MPVVGQLCNPLHILVRLINEEDFLTVMTRGNSDVDGVPYKVFHWTPGFNEDDEPPLVSIWITLLGLPPVYFQYSMLKSFGDGFGHFLECENATLYVMRPEGTRICVEMDVSAPLISHFWIDPPRIEKNHYQEVIIVIGVANRVM